jgi:molecular chaperone Hsp33
MSEFQKFLFEGLPVRGMLVKLTDSWQTLQGRRAEALPAPVMRLLGELSACALLMQSNLKFDGALIIQIAGDGPVKLAVAEARNGLLYRATAKMQGEVLDDAAFADLVNLRGQGRCAITLDPSDRPPGVEPYQGVVQLNDDDGLPLRDLAAAIEHYMAKSEQLDTKVVLAADAQTAAGALIQRLPLQGEGNLEGQLTPEQQEEIADAYPRIAMKTATLKAEELLGLSTDTILHRLFWEEQLRRYEPGTPRFECTCSRERVGRMLVNLGREEVDSVLAEQGQVEIGCDFCGAQYRFDAVDSAQLFVTAGSVQAAQGGLQ